MKEKLTDKQVLEKIEKYMRLTKMPETDYYDISIGEITALVHMEDVFAAIARLPYARRPLESVTEIRQQNSRPENGAAVPISADIDSESRFPQVKTKFNQVKS